MKHIRNLSLIDQVLQNSRNELQSFYYQLSNQFSKPTFGRIQEHDIESKVDSIKKVLVQNVAGYKPLIREVSWSEVQHSLMPVDIAIEFVHFNYH